LKSAYREFEERLGNLPQPKGEKTTIVRDAINSFRGTFSVAEIQQKCPGVGIDMIRRVLKNMQAEGMVKCIKRGRDAKWQKKVIG
jgi:ribosomal protein S25